MLGKLGIPIDRTIYKLFCDLYFVVFPVIFGKLGHISNSLSKEAIRDREHIWFMNDSEVLVIKMSMLLKPLSSWERRTLRGLDRANSNAIWPILLEALSVINRVARASRPCSPIVCVSCLTYWNKSHVKAVINTKKNTDKTFSVLTNNN